MTRSAKLLPSAVEAIGETPLVDLSRIAAGTGGRILAKLELLNPGFLKKDRCKNDYTDQSRSQMGRDCTKGVVNPTPEA